MCCVSLVIKKGKQLLPLTLFHYLLLLPLHEHRDICPLMRINIRYLLAFILSAMSDI